MLPFPESFERRPVCFIGLSAGIWGALRPVEQLQAIFGYRNALIFPERVFMPGIGKLLDDSGKFTDPELTPPGLPNRRRVRRRLCRTPVREKIAVRVGGGAGPVRSRDKAIDVRGSSCSPTTNFSWIT